LTWIQNDDDDDDDGLLRSGMHHQYTPAWQRIMDNICQAGAEVEQLSLYAAFAASKITSRKKKDYILLARICLLGFASLIYKRIRTPGNMVKRQFIEASGHCFMTDQRNGTSSFLKHL